MGKIAITRCDWCRVSSPCGSDDKAGSGEEAGSGCAAVPLRQHSTFATLLSQQCSAFTAYQTYLRYKAWVAQRHQTMSPLAQPGLHINLYLVTNMLKFNACEMLLQVSIVMAISICEIVYYTVNTITQERYS